VIRAAQDQPRLEPYWYVTATWNLWTLDRFRVRAASRELALASAQRLIAEHSAAEVARYGAPSLELRDSFRDEGGAEYRQERVDFEPATDPDVCAVYLAEVAAEAERMVARIAQGGAAMIGYSSRRSPIDYNLFFVDVYETAERLCEERGLGVVGGHLDDIGLALRPA
jgi:hypothetical protein